MGKTYSNSKGSDRKVAKSMDELETLIRETHQPSRFQRRKIMTINATVSQNKNAGHSMKASVLSSAAAAAVATPVRIEPSVSVHLDGVLQTAANQALPGSSVVVEVKEHLNNAMHELEEMSAALKPVTAIVAVENASRTIPPAPLTPPLNKTETEAYEMITEQTTEQLILAKAAIDILLAARAAEQVAPSAADAVEILRANNQREIAAAIAKLQALEAPSVQPYVPLSNFVTDSQQEKPMMTAEEIQQKLFGAAPVVTTKTSSGFFSGIADSYDNMGTTGKVVTGVIVVAAVVGAGYYAYKRFNDNEPVGYNNLLNNDELA